jgi:hypothetical protein
MQSLRAGVANKQQATQQRSTSICITSIGHQRQHTSKAAAAKQ